MSDARLGAEGRGAEAAVGGAAVMGRGALAGLGPVGTIGPPPAALGCPWKVLAVSKLQVSKQCPAVSWRKPGSGPGEPQSHGLVLLTLAAGL